MKTSCYSDNIISNENISCVRIPRTNRRTNLKINPKIVVFLAAILSFFIFLSVSSYAIMNVSSIRMYPDTDTKIKITWSGVTGAASTVKYSIYRANASEINNINLINVSDGFTWTKIFEGNDTFSFIDGQDTALIPVTSYVYKVVSEYTAANNEMKFDYGYITISTSSPISPIIKDYAYNINTNTFAIEVENLSRAAKRYRTVDSVYSVVYEAYLDLDDAGSVSNVIKFTKPSVKGWTLGLRVMVYSNENDYSGYSDQITMTAIFEPFITAKIGIDYVDIDGLPNMNYFRVQRAIYTAGVIGEWSNINPTVVNDYVVRDKLIDDKSYVYRLVAKEESCYVGYSNITTPVSRATGIKGLKYTIINGPKVKLMWTVEDKGYSIIRIEKKVDNGGYEPLVTLDSSSNMYYDMNIIADKNYKYRFWAYQNTGTGILGPEIALELNAPKLSVIAGADNSNELSWEPKMNDSLGVTIERKMDNGDFNILASNYVDEKYVDADITSGHSYVYRIKMRALEFVGKSYSNEVSCYNSGNVATVSDLEAVADSGTSIKLKWNYSSTGVIGASIQRKVDGQLDWTTVTTLDLPLLTYTDTGLLEGTKCYYRVRATIGTNVYSAYYPEGDDVFAYTKPKKPEGLSGKRDESGKILLSWTKNTNMTRFDVFRKNENENEFTKLAEVTSDTSTWMDEEAVWKFNYKYRITGILEDISSEPSVDLEIKKLEEPVDNVISYIDGNSLFIKWNLREGYAKPVNLQKKDENTGEWKIVSMYEDGDKIFESKNIKIPGEYKFKITGVNIKSGATIKSDEIVVSAKILEKPETLRLRPISTSGVRLTWINKTQKCDGFAIFRVSDNGYKEIGRTTKDVTIFDDSGLSQGETYAYFVCAYANNIFSSNSNLAMITMPNIGVIKVPIAFSWATDALREMDKRGAIPQEMLTQSNFLPKNYVTRAEFVTMLIRMSNVKRTNSTGFKDISADSWYKEDIAWAKDSGIVAGGSNGAFNPEDRITRQDITVVLFKMLALNNKNLQSYSTQVLSKFSDNKEVAPYAAPSMAYLVGENLIKGVSQDILAPRSYATRGEAITLIYNVLIKSK